MTFITVQRMAAEAGLTMSRDYGSMAIRLRFRHRPRGPRWVVESLTEALDVIRRYGRTCERSDAA